MAYVDRREALALLEAEVAELRHATYGALVARLLDKQESFGRVGSSGKRYAIEIRAFWDDGLRENLRVRAMIGDGGWRAFAPLPIDFIRAPDGSFVDE